MFMALPFKCILIFIIVINVSHANEVLTSFNLKLVCDLNDKTTLISPKGTYENIESISGEIVDVTVTHLSSSPASRFLSVRAMKSPYIQHHIIPLFESKADSCSIDFQRCQAKFTEDEISAGKEYARENERINQRVKIDRTTGRLEAHDISTDHGITLIHRISGFCKRAPVNRAF